MSSPATSTVIELVRRRGPLTVAEFMDVALYHPGAGYYSSAPRRSGRSGDFFTSVDVGPLFGNVIAVQLVEIVGILEGLGFEQVDIVEAGAADGRLSNDVLDALAREHPSLYERVHVTLVERSEAGRRAHDQTLAAHRARVTSRPALPDGIVGVILANELLDALPVHVVVATIDGLREVYVSARGDRLGEVLGPVSSPAVTRHLEDSGLALEPGRRFEVCLAADEWIRAAGSALRCGFLLLFDYFRRTSAGVSSTGTLTTHLEHTTDAVDYLDSPGACDLTTHVDLDAMRRAAVHAGLTELGAVDQTYFLLALGLLDRLESGFDAPVLQRRLAAGTLIAPGGLGSTMKAVAFSKQVPGVGLRGVSGGRLT